MTVPATDARDRTGISDLSGQLASLASQYQSKAISNLMEQPLSGTQPA